MFQLAIVVNVYKSVLCYPSPKVNALIYVGLVFLFYFYDIDIPPWQISDFKLPT